MSETLNVIELGQQLETARSAWKSKYEGFALKTLADGTQARDIPANELEVLDRMMKDINELAPKFERANDAARFAEENAKLLSGGQQIVHTPNHQAKEYKSVGTLFSETKNRTTKGDRDFNDVSALEFMGGFGVKTTMTTGANGFPPEVLRDGNIVPAISRPPQLIDFLRIENTTQNAIKFMAQTVRTNNAVPKSEGSALDEAVITYAEQTDIISRIGTFIPVTEEQLEDEPGVRSLIDNDLALMVRQKLDSEITVGTGVDPLLLGIFATTNIATQARGTDPVLDAFFKAFTKVRVDGRSNPSLAVIHSTDWQNLVLTRTTDGLYILGNPSDQTPMRIWGMQVALSEALTATNAMVIDPFYFRIKMRKGVTIAITDAHGENFVANKLVIRAHIRAGIQHLRGQAACKITGLP